MSRKNRSNNKHGWDNFPITEQALIRAAQTEHPGRRNKAFTTISAEYWTPLYDFLVRKNNTPSRAMDLVQGFFCELIIEKQIIREYVPEKCGFRAFLLTEIKQFVRQQHRKETTQTRHPTKPFVALEDRNGHPLQIAAGERNADQQYMYDWAWSQVQKASSSVREDLSEDGKENYWAIFDARVLRPKLEGVKPVRLKELCHKYGIPSEGTVTRIVENVTKRLKTTLRSSVGRYVGSEEEIDEEIRDLIRIISEGRANP